MQDLFHQLLLRALAEPRDEALFNWQAQQMRDALHAHPGMDVPFHGRPLAVPPGVYLPKMGSSTHLVCSYLAGPNDLPLAGRRVLDMGCGSGAISILALDLGARDAVALDIDPTAVAAAEHNLRQEIAEGRAVVAQSDLFEAVGGERFDVIVFNQPFYHPIDTSRIQAGMLESVDGEVLQRFLDQAGEHLTEDGVLLITFSTYSNPELLNHPAWSFQVECMDWTRRTAHARALLSGRKRTA